ncbi:MAG: hypothetical protein QNL62_16685, partial [Gammaproteobacteria bacterium]|nr:hypothetical protein [Gammaproteobacteria bacterium]
VEHLLHKCMPLLGELRSCSVRVGFALGPLLTEAEYICAATPTYSFLVVSSEGPIVATPQEGFEQ